MPNIDCLLYVLMAIKIHSISLHVQDFYTVYSTVLYLFIVLVKESFYTEYNGYQEDMDSVEPVM